MNLKEAVHRLNSYIDFLGWRIFGSGKWHQNYHELHYICPLQYINGCPITNKTHIGHTFYTRWYRGDVEKWYCWTCQEWIE